MPIVVRGALRSTASNQREKERERERERGGGEGERERERERATERGLPERQSPKMCELTDNDVKFGYRNEQLFKLLGQSRSQQGESVCV